MVARNEFPRHPPEIFSCFHSVAISFRSLQRRLLLAKSHSVQSAMGHTALRPQQKVLLPRRSYRLSGGVKIDVVRDLRV